MKVNGEMSYGNYGSNGDTSYEKYYSGSHKPYNTKLQEEVEAARKNSFVRNTVFITFLVVVLLFVYTTRFHQYHEDDDSPFAVTPQIPDTIIESDDGQLSIYATNEYGHYEGPYPFFDDYPGAQLVEPYKETIIQLTGSLASSSFNYLWKIEGESSTLEGDLIQVTLTEPGLFTIDVHIFDDGKYISTYSTHLIVRYVKREIRSLTTADREKFLDAAYAMWQYDTETGRSLYGEKFTGIHTYVREHSIASEDVMCDQFHDGSGFVTHHLALSNSFEASLRTIDPSVTLPYWDFSIEGQAIDDLDELPSYLMNVTPVFSDDWFGSVDSDNHIADSRWAHASMPRLDNTDDFDSSAPHNSYGFFRSYWNNNPDTEIVRHMFDVCGVQDTYKPIATCQAVYNVLDIETLAEMQTLTPVDKTTDLHGPMHTQMGGMFGGCDDAYRSFVDRWSDYLAENLTSSYITSTGQTAKTFLKQWGYTAQRRVMLDKFIMNEYYRIYRGLWRSHMCAVDNSITLLQCPESCSDDVSFEECSCSVPKLDSGETTWENLLPCVVFSESNREYFNKTMSVEFMEDLVKTIASAPVKEGEMIQSSSPADILFWMVHPVIERVLSAKRISTVTDVGGTSFGKWTNGEDSTSDMWLSYSYYNIEAGTNKYWPDDYTCVGHAADDPVLPVTLPFTDALLSSGDVNNDGILSNWEFYTALDPNNFEANDYVFDNFEWNHCVGAISVASS